MCLTILGEYSSAFNREQFEQSGFVDQIKSLPIAEIMNSLLTNFGQHFMEEYFPARIEPMAFATTFDHLITYGALGKKTINDEFGTALWKQVVSNIKQGNVPISFIARRYGKDALNIVLQMGIQIHHGKYPEAFPFLSPDHHHTHPRAEEMITKSMPLVHLERSRNVQGAEFFETFDVLYYINAETHIFSDVMQGHCMRAKPNAQQYKPGEPGCWWIPPARLFVAAKLTQGPLSSKRIFEVFSAPIKLRTP